MAKLDARRVAAFLADPGPCRLALLTGDDAGLIRERAEALVRAASGGEEMRVAEIPARDAARDAALLAAEAATPALMGGRRAVWVREGAGDGLLAAARAALEGRGPGLVILEAPELPGRSKLKALALSDPHAALLECWRERGADLAASAARMLRELGVEADGNAAALLAERAGEDRLLLRREAEKLALYAGVGGRLTAEDVMEVAGEGGGLDLDDALLAATAGDVAAADRALHIAMAEGANPVQVLRAALRHTRRLQEAARAMANGSTPQEAMNTLRPPVFFRARPLFEKSLRRWSPTRLEALGSALLRAERQAKSTGAPDALLARHAVLGMARV